MIALGLANITVATKTLVSPKSRPNILELYTSQGCSSCPSVEHWINTLTKQYIDQPQHAYRKFKYTHSIATPGFVIAYQQHRVANDVAAIETKIPTQNNFTSDRKAIVVWLSQGKDPSPIQAVADWL